MLGVHWLAHAEACDIEVLADAARLSEVLVRLPLSLGLSLMEAPVVRPVKGGWAGIVLLGESHAAIHTDLAARAAYVDVFSCTTLDPVLAEHLVRAMLGAASIRAELVQR